MKHSKQPTLKASTFAIRTSQPHKAKIAKELALQTHIKTDKK